MDLNANAFKAEVNTRYQTVEKQLNDAETTYQFTYGIVVLQGEQEIFRIEDITVNKEQLEQLVLKCNEMKVSYCHIYDVVEDFLLR